MRVALVCPYSLSVPGGVQGQVLGLRRALTAAGTEAVVVAPCDGPAPTDGIIAVGPTVAIPANGSRAPVAITPWTLSKAARVLRNGGFDVVHLHEPLAPGSTWAALAVSPAPMAGTFHRSGAGRGYKAAARVLRPLVRRLAWRGAVSTEARATACEVLGGGAGDFEVMFNGIEVDRFARADPWPAGDGCLPILFVGRHEHRKGLAILLEAYRLLASGALGGVALAHEAVLWIAGGGPETGRLRHEAAGATQSGAVEWLGRITDAELAARLRSAALVALPALGGESFGVVLLEAMASGTPVVASDIAGYRSVAAGHALLVPPGDPRALAEALSAVLADAAAGAGRAAPKVLAAASAHAGTFSMAALAHRYQEVYVGIAETSKLRMR